jgi:ADP-dependent NAD(P)H-hydrate dehydratase / NAD(P)H-hydrate epimerase
MLKILSTKQIKALDACTIEQEPIQSIDLMERACRAFVTWFTQHIDASKKIGIVCGPGNNGGDGLGIARMLKEWGYPVKIWVVKGNAPESSDFKLNLQRVNGSVEINEIVSESDQGLFSDRDVVIDAIFGSGLSRPADGIYAQAIRCINQTDALRVAVDIPSGLMADSPSSGDIVRADYTVSFQLPKLAFLLPQSFQFTGECIIVDIGLSKKFVREAETSFYQSTKKAVSKILKKRSKFDHKGTFGHSLIIAGSYGKMGAAVLASRAALRAGTGLLTVHIPQKGYEVLQTAVPEAMAEADKHPEFATELGDLSKYNSLGIGPGLGQNSDTVTMMKKALEKFGKPVVIDADGLNILAANRESFHLVPPGSILTPHPKEFERLVGAWKNDFERLEKQKQLAATLKSVIILKGAYTSIAAPDGVVYFNSTGNPGMATGGTGDVLTGILTGLLAQQYSARDAAILGVYVHGLSADLIAQEKGIHGLIASDLVDFLPMAFKKLSRE